MSPIIQSAVHNGLLAALPPSEFALLAAFLTPVDLIFNEFLYQAEQPMEAAYFIETGMVSCIASLESGEAVEVGLIGAEGVVGLPVAFGVVSIPQAALVQLGGTAYRLNAATLRQAFGASEALRDRLLRWLQVLHTQVVQTGVCNGHHLLEKRLARWLLMVHDRAGDDRFPMTHEFMGMMLGVRRAGVTVASGALKKAGLVDYANGHMTIRDRRGLEDTACECYGVVQRHRAQFQT